MIVILKWLLKSTEGKKNKKVLFAILFLMFTYLIKAEDKCVHSPVYSAMEVMEEAVEPLSQSLSVVRLVRLPGNDSTESQLKRATRERNTFKEMDKQGGKERRKKNRTYSNSWTDAQILLVSNLPLGAGPSRVNTVGLVGGSGAQRQTGSWLGVAQVVSYER